MESLNDSLNLATDTLVRQLGGDGGSSFGVHIVYDDLWFAMVYLAAIYVMGWLFETILFCPALVGQIATGIIFGPSLLDIVPYEEAFVLFGEIGLVLLVIEAGVDIDVTTLKLIGKRGVIIATLGSIFPIAIGLGIAFAIGADVKAAIAAGAAFGPTSLGIAMNILRSGKIINTPTGQLIVAAAIIDDMIALIILSQLGGLVGEITVLGVLIPIISALCFLVIGGYLALFVLPGILDKFIFKEGMSAEKHGKLALTIMLGLVIGLMQATHHTKASHLMGAFIAGLVFCTDHDLHVTFVSQFKRVLQWLMRIFFASTIGFQVPVKKFANGTVIWQGLVFTLALLGKLGVGFLVPNFTQSKNYTGNHLRDCLIVGCSMAAEGEFAFVIAAFSVDKGLIGEDLYSSIVLAILLSTIIAPFSLRFTISYFNKRALAEVEMAEAMQSPTASLADGILEGTTVFFCINTTSHAAWGTLPSLMRSLFELDLEVIDHRSWHSKFEDTVINEVYAKGVMGVGMDIQSIIEKVQMAVKESISQEDSLISVTRWIPGAVAEMVESAHDGKVAGGTPLAEKLFNEAQEKLERSEHKDSKKDEVLSRIDMGVMPISETSALRTRAPSKRIRIVSTPVGGGGMFNEGTEVFKPAAPLRQRRRHKTMSTPLSGDMWGENTTVVLTPGEVLVNVIGPNNVKYAAKMKEETLTRLRTGGAPLTLVELQQDSFNLDGFVRRKGRVRSLSNVANEEKMRKENML
jgi:Kef-type K+ transport system membrane component KefB